MSASALARISRRTRPEPERRRSAPPRSSSARAALLFHCSGRKVFSQVAGKGAELAATFAAAPTCAGMNVQFEIYCGFSINSTLTSLAFGAS